MKINKYHRDLPLSHAENVPEIEYNSESEHPTPEQLLMREAIKYLTPRQRKVWEYYNYDRLTQDEIACKLKMKQPNVAISIQAIEKRIIKWVKSNLGAYNLLKSEFKSDD